MPRGYGSTGHQLASAADDLERQGEQPFDSPPDAERSPAGRPLAIIVAAVTLALVGVIASQNAANGDVAPAAAAAGFKTESEMSQGPHAYEAAAVPSAEAAEEELELEAALSTKDSASSKTAPNIVFIIADGMGYNDIGYLSQDLTDFTPTMNKLAAEGIKFTNVYSQQECSPSRSALMTGRYPIRYGMQGSNFQMYENPAMPDESEMFLMEYLAANGYTNYGVGKWGLGFVTTTALPTSRGFDEFYGFYGSSNDYLTHHQLPVDYLLDPVWDDDALWVDGDADAEPIDGGDFPTAEDSGREGDSPIADGSMTLQNGALGMAYLDLHYDVKGEDSVTDFSKTNVYSTYLYGDSASEYIRNQPEDEPMFLYYSPMTPHSPLEAPTELTQAYGDMLNGVADGDRRTIAAMYLALDIMVEKIVTDLEETGLMDNTILIVTSDHGGNWMYGASNYPLRGEKASYWDGGIKVPTFMYAPGVLDASLSGTTYDNLMHVTDWLPTLVEGAAGGSVQAANPGVTIDGFNHWDAITSGSTAEVREEMLIDLLYSGQKTHTDDDEAEGEYDFVYGAYRIGDWKLLLNTPDCVVCDLDTQTTSSCDSCNFKTGDEDNNYLFNMKLDPSEQDNKFYDDEYADIVAELMGRMDEYLEVTEYPQVVSTDTDCFYYWDSLGYVLEPWVNPDGSSKWNVGDMEGLNYVEQRPEETFEKGV